MFKKMRVNIDCILVTLIFNMNVLRFLMNTYSTTASMYLVYLLAIIIMLNKYKHNIALTLSTHRNIKTIYVLHIIILIYALLTSVFAMSLEIVAILGKFLISTVIASLCLSMPIHKIKLILLLNYVINILYGFILFAFPERADTYLSGDANYLNLTLTLGFVLTMSLAELVCGFVLSTKLLRVLLFLPFSVFLFLVLINFNARGVLVFPPQIAVILTILLYKQNKIRSSIFLLVLGGLFAVAFLFFMNNASDYVTGRFLRIFEDTEDESRIGIWTKALEHIVDNCWFLIGGGINAFRENYDYYPHNIFLQYFGEYGLFGLSTMLYCIRIIYKKIKPVLSSHENQNYDILIICLSGLLYYFFTFNKSFSIYDACPLQIIYILTLSILLQFNKKDGKCNYYNP